MTTVAALSDRVLKELMILIGGETSSAVDGAEAREAVLSVIETLGQHSGGRGLVDIEADTDGEAFPDERVVCLVAGIDITPPTSPADLQRFGVSPLDGDVTVTPYRRKLNGVTTATTVSTSTVWVYNADETDWKAITGLTLTSDVPYPRWAHTFIVLLAAHRLADQYGIAITPQLMGRIEDARQKMRETLILSRDIANLSSPVSARTRNAPRSWGAA